MPGFSSMDDLISKITVNGQISRLDFQKTLATGSVAGTWTDLGPSAGSVPVNIYSGTSLTFYPTDDLWGEGAIYHGGNVSPATKHFLNASATIFAAAGAPWYLMCVDQVGYVPITGADVTATTTRTITMTPIGTGTSSVDRYPNGVGLRAYFSVEVPPATGGPNLTEFTYTSTSGTTGRSCPLTPSMAATPVAGQVPHSGNATNRYAPFIPLAINYADGIKDLETFRFNGGTAYTGSGQLVLHLVKPLWQIPIPSNGILTERDFVNQLPSLPKIPDGACLRFILFQTGATTTTSPVMVSADVAWG